MSKKHPPKRAPSTRTEPGLNDIPRWLPATVFALITIVLFRGFIFGKTSLLGTDTMALSYFARQFYTTFVHNFHRFPLWNPLLYGGLPFVDGMHGDIFYPPSLALFFLSAEKMWGWKIVLHVFMAGLFMYLWLREIGVSRGSAMLGGIIYMMGADLVSLVLPGGDGKLFVSALAPLAFLLTERAVRLGRVRDYAAFSLGVALMILTSHMQCAYFAIWGITLYFIFRLVQRWKHSEITPSRAAGYFGAFAVAGLLAGGATAIQIVPPLSYLREWSHRASKTEQALVKDAYVYSTTYSLHPEEILALAVPEFVGDNVQTETHSGGSYWGRNGFKINSEYAGLIGIVLLPLLFLRRRRGQTWFFVGLSVLSLLYALGADTPFFHVFYLIPGVKLFRAPSIIIFLYGMSIATLAALAFDRAAELARAPDDEPRAVSRTLWIVTGAIGVLALLATAGVFTKLWVALFYHDIDSGHAAALQSNLPAIKMGFWIAFAVAAAVAGAIEGYARRMWSARTVLIALCVVAFFEQYRADAPFIRGTVLMNQNADPALFRADESIDFLQQRMKAGEVFRVLDLSYLIPQLQGQGYAQNVLAIHGIEQTAGHHGNEMGRYRELLGGEQPINLQSSFNLLDLTNTEYIVTPQAVELPGYTEAFRGSRSVVLRKADILPRAYLVGTVEVVPDTGAVNRMLAPGFDYHKKAIVPAPLPAGTQIQPDPQGTVTWIERSANEQILKVKSDRPALLMVLDNYYPAWHAHIDGQDAQLLRANYAFRAIPVPAGEHEVKVTYLASSLHTPAMISALVLIALMLAAFGAPLLDRVRRKSVA